MNKVIKWILSTVTALFMAVAFIGAGLAVCAVPDMTTRVVSESTCNTESSSFNAQQLATMAVSTKQYTVNVHDRAQLDNAMRDLNGGRDLTKLNERFKLTEDAVGHLDDVHTVLVHTGIVVGCVVLVAILLTVLCGLWKGSILVGDMLIEAGIITLVAMIAFGVFAYFNFSALFDAMHSLLFEEGTWTFSGDSLLICMYPARFWTTMGIIWGGTAAGLGIVAIVVGVLLHIIGKQKQRIPYPFAQPGYDILYY